MKFTFDKNASCPTNATDLYTQFRIALAANKPMIADIEGAFSRHFFEQSIQRIYREAPKKADELLTIVNCSIGESLEGFIAAGRRESLRGLDLLVTQISERDTDEILVFCGLALFSLIVLLLFWAIPAALIVPAVPLLAVLYGKARGIAYKKVAKLLVALAAIYATVASAIAVTSVQQSVENIGEFQPGMLLIHHDRPKSTGCNE